RVRSLTSPNPSESIPPFAADESDHFTLRREPERRFIGMAGDIQMRNQVVLHTVGARHELQLPFVFGIRLCGVVRNPIRLASMPGHPPKPFPFGEHSLRRAPLPPILGE